MIIRKRYEGRGPVEVKPTPTTSVYRYSDFEDLRSRLAFTFPNAGQALPPLPPKNAFRKPPRRTWI